MTNMMPQAANNNSGPWEKLEKYCRTLVSQGKELYIYAGGYGSQGTIDNGHVTVPSHTWKVIMVLDTGENDLNRVTTTTRLLQWICRIAMIRSVEQTTGKIIVFVSIA